MYLGVLSGWQARLSRVKMPLPVKSRPESLISLQSLPNRHYETIKDPKDPQTCMSSICKYE